MLNLHDFFTRSVLCFGYYVTSVFHPYDIFIPDHLGSQLSTKTERCFHAFVENGYYCHAFNIVKAHIRLSNFDVSRQARCVHYQCDRAFNAL